MKEKRITCIYCGREIKRSHAVPVYRRSRFENLPYLQGVVKGYACISCAKHRKISFRPWRQKIINQERKIIEKRRKKALGQKKSNPNQ
jgi:hypothetical protein